jgi:photosystem II stability/assembly factor-like uncharacterized protein
MPRALKIILIAAFVFSVQTANGEWVKQKTSSFSWLRDVYFSSDTRGWIVGTDGTILTSADGGSTWNTTPKFTTDSLLQVHFTDENTGWMLCERNIFSRGQNATSYLRKTVDGGRSWEKIEFENAGRERVTKIVFNRLGWGTAFGEGGIFYKLQEDGRTWKKSASAIHFVLLSGSFSEGQTGGIAGTGGTIMFTENNGLVWEKATLIGDTETRFNSIFFASERLGWAVGSRGAIFSSTGGGRLWRSQESGTAANLNDVYFVNTREGWAVGDDGVILHTGNGGLTWSEVNSRVKHRLERVYFHGKHGWAVGFGGTVLSYEAGSSSQPPANRPQLRQDH